MYFYILEEEKYSSCYNAIGDTCINSKYLIGTNNTISSFSCIFLLQYLLLL